MKVMLNFKTHTCIVTKEKGDPRFHRTDWSSAESTFLFRVAQSLKAQGFDVIKKRMYKDGHMVDDLQQYVRTRKWTTEDAEHEWCVFNTNYALFDAGEIFNKEPVGGTVELMIVGKE